MRVCVEIVTSLIQTNPGTMMKHPKREGSPIAQDVPMCPMSPNSRRRAEFTIKQLQSGMMGRARSKLSTLGDVWRPRSMVGPAKQSVEAALPPKGSSHKTHEFLSLWARLKKASGDENAAVTKILSRDKSQSRKPVLVDTSNKKSSTVVLSNGQTIHDKSHNSNNDPLQQQQNRRRRHNTIIPSETSKMTASLSSMSAANRYSRNNSLDLSELLQDRARIDDLVFSNGRPTTWSISPLKMRRNSYTDQVPDDLSECAATNSSRASVDIDSRVIKARLKLKKVPSCEGDIESYSANAAPKPGILNRHRATTEPRSDESIVSDRNCLLPLQPQRPRKKLSFRIPVEYDGQPLAIKSDTLPRARRFLERYEQQQQQQQTLDQTLNVELEVRKV